MAASALLRLGWMMKMALVSPGSAKGTAMVLRKLTPHPPSRLIWVDPTKLLGDTRLLCLDRAETLAERWSVTLGYVAVREPRRLRRGKEFHKVLQAEWERTNDARSEYSITDMRGRRGRIDVLIEDPDWVAVIEIKRSDWDRMRPHRVRPNALRHARQIWRYIDVFVDREGRDVCPGVIYEIVPATPGRVDEVEAILNDEGIQVVWETESIADLKKRMGTATAESARSQ